MPKKIGLRQAAPLEEEKDEQKEKWLIISYAPTTFFSLRMTHATSKGGKTLFVPTPYAVKLALIDACFRMYGQEEALNRAHAVFDLIKAREIRLRPPAYCVVQNTFLKVKQEEREAPRGLYVPTIAYRELCYFKGDLAIAIEVTGLPAGRVDELADLAMRVNYFGKRGSFMQYLHREILDGTPGKGFTCPEDRADLVGGGFATTLYLDEFGSALIQEKDGFARINSYGGKPSALGKYRVLVRTLLPYRYISSGKHYTLYKRTDIS